MNQLLAKIDGVEALNNILLIGMTNRLDMIDEALLRPGRLELKMPIGERPFRAIASSSEIPSSAAGRPLLIPPPLSKFA